MEKHLCKAPYEAERSLWGKAITKCEEDENNKLFVDNEEYGSQVNFCPYCGYQAKVKIKEFNN
jgi:hypothetical protein